MFYQLKSFAPIAALALAAACVPDTGTTPVVENAPAVSGGLPQFNATCPLGISVHADSGGPVFVNATEAGLKKFSDSFYEATRGDVTVSITINSDGTVSVSYNKRGSGNGFCTVAG